MNWLTGIGVIAKVVEGCMSVCNFRHEYSMFHDGRCSILDQMKISRSRAPSVNRSFSDVGVPSEPWVYCRRSVDGCPLWVFVCGESFATWLRIKYFQLANTFWTARPVISAICWHPTVEEYDWNTVCDHFHVFFLQHRDLPVEHCLMKILHSDRIKCISYSQEAIVTPDEHEPTLKIGRCQ